MITLALTSSTALVGVALADASAGTVLSSRSVLTDRRHAEEITPMLAAVLAHASLEFDVIERIVVDVGPGRYTGMRVGIATAKALAFALGIPVEAVSSLELIGLGAGSALLEEYGSVFAVVDARRDQVFAQQVDRTGPIGSPMVLSPTELIGMLPDRGVSSTLLVGDGADRYAEELAVVATVEKGVAPNAEAAAMLDPARRGGPGYSVVPLYLREPDAAINIKTRHTVAIPKKRRSRP